MDGCACILDMAEESTACQSDTGSSIGCGQESISGILINKVLGIKLLIHLSMYPLRRARAAIDNTTTVRVRLCIKN